MTPTIVVLGHKDHGKSTFLGRLLLNTDSVPNDKVETIKEIDAEAGRPFELAHLLDSFREEREQEMTYDTASVFVHGKKGAYIFVDVPGHSELVHQMISGASKANIAVLIISAKEGIDAMSVKHLVLASFLGIKKLIVAVNKMDAVHYNENVFKEITSQISKIFAGKFGADAEVFYIPISANEGENVVRVSSKMSWFNGKSVFEKIEEILEKSNVSRQLLRALVQDIYDYNNQSVAAVVVKNGELKNGMDVLVMPSGKKITIEHLFSSSGKETNTVQEAENASIVVRKEWGIERGTIISSEENPPLCTKRAESEVFLFEYPKLDEPLFIECGLMNSSQESLPPPQIQEVEKMEIKLAAPILFDKEETFLNKFVIKQSGGIIGVGRITHTI